MCLTEGALFQIMLRVVPFDQRTLALGINWTFLRLLGMVSSARWIHPCCLVNFGVNLVTSSQPFHSFRLYSRRNSVRNDDRPRLPRLGDGLWTSTELSGLRPAQAELDYHSPWWGIPSDYYIMLSSFVSGPLHGPCGTARRHIYLFI